MLALKVLTKGKQSTLQVGLFKCNNIVLVLKQGALVVLGLGKFAFRFLIMLARWSWLEISTFMC